MQLIDTHSHLYDEAFDSDFGQMVLRARECGVAACVMPGISSASFERMTAAADALPGFAFPCLGLHPTEVGGNWREELAFVENHLNDRQFYAIGEIGLDEYWTKDFVKEQMEVCEAQIEMAARCSLPVILHVREATRDLFRLLSDVKGLSMKGVFHAFSGSYETYRELLKYGDFKFGIGGVVTFRKASLAETVVKMSLDDIILETDCPYLTPSPHRGERNESSYVKFVAEKVASLKDVEIETVASLTTANAVNLFKLELSSNEF